MIFLKLRKKIKKVYQFVSKLALWLFRLSNHYVASFNQKISTLLLNYIVREQISRLLSFIFYILFLKFTAIAYAQEPYWEDQWIQGAPLDKQPEWFRINHEDPRTLYEQMNGPTWHYIKDNYDLSSHDNSYKPFRWWDNNDVLPESDSSLSDTSSSSSSDSESSSNSDIIFIEEDMRELLSQYKDLIENTTEDHFHDLLSFIEKSLPKEIFAKNLQELADPNSTIAQYSLLFQELDPNYALDDAALLLHFKSTIYTYNNILICDYLDITSAKNLCNIHKRYLNEFMYDFEVSV